MGIKSIVEKVCGLRVDVGSEGGVVVVGVVSRVVLGLVVVGR